MKKLTPLQDKVMLWLSQGWHARRAYCAVVEINGERVCSTNTMEALTRRGLVMIDPHTRQWVATDEGKKLSPTYREPESPT